jgi:hypothetical protein
MQDCFATSHVLSDILLYDPLRNTPARLVSGPWYTLQGLGSEPSIGLGLTHYQAVHAIFGKVGSQYIFDWASQRSTSGRRGHHAVKNSR